MNRTLVRVDTRRSWPRKVGGVRGPDPRTEDLFLVRAHPGHTLRLGEDYWEKGDPSGRL